MPFQFVIFSDLHLHGYSFQSTDTGSLGQMHGLNTRLLHCYEAARSAADYAVANDIDLVLFGGDFTHSKKPHLDKDVVNVFHHFFQSYVGSPLTFGIVPGNHDYIDKQGLNHSLLSIASYPHVVLMDWTAREQPADLFRFETKQGELFVRAVPYTEDGALLRQVIQAPLPDLPPDAFKILLSHAGMQGARVGSDYILIKDHDLSSDEVPKNVFDACFFGHFHEHQVVFHKGWIIGSTHQMNWSDAGGLRGFCHVTIHDDRTVELKHIPTDPSIPRFHVLDSESDYVGVRAHDFVKYKAVEALTEETKERIEGLVAAQIGTLPTSFEIIPLPPEKKEIQLSERAVSADTALHDWVEQRGTGFDQEKLLLMGQELLMEARRSLE